MRTPSGSPASLASSARRRAESGDCSAGLSTTELPVTKAGANFQVAISNGKFHGTTAPITPSGERRIIATSRPPVGAISSYILSTASACHWKKKAEPGASTLTVSEIGFPMSKVSNRAISVTFSRISLARFRITSLRSLGVFPDQRPSSKAARAAFTAASMSLLLPLATSHSFLPVAGLMVENVSPLMAGTKRPSIQHSVQKSMLFALEVYSSKLCIVDTFPQSLFITGHTIRRCISWIECTRYIVIGLRLINLPRFCNH